MIIELIKAILVGCIAALPIGPILIMVVQRTLSGGRRAGIMVGVGAATADMLYAAAGMFALALVEDFIARYTEWLLLAGGILLGLIGLGMIRRKIVLAGAAGSGLPPVKYALQSFASVLSNPAALAVMMALLSAFSLDRSSASAPLWLLVICVGLGELLYWLLVVTLLRKFVKVSDKTLNIVNKIMGGLVCVFALVLLVKAVLQLL